MPTITINYDFVQGEQIVYFQVDGNLPIIEICDALNTAHKHFEQKVIAYNKLKADLAIGDYNRLSYREVLEEMDNKITEV
jgi:hypothetical protein